MGCGMWDWGICSGLSNKPDWIPSFLWSETFPRNVKGFDMQPVDLLVQCGPGFDGVYPAMIYETLMAIVLFAMLWAVRRHGFKGGGSFHSISSSLYGPALRQR